MSCKVKWGILGSNALISVKCVIPAICKSGNSSILAIASGNPKDAGKIAAKYQIPNVYAQYEALLTDPDIDAVYIPLPNHLHLPWTLRALEAGKHVLCEKPLARNAAEATAMAQAAKAAGCCLMEAMMYRFHPRSLAVREMVRHGRIGDLRLIRAAFSFHMNEDSLKYGDNFRFFDEKGGGAIMDVGCYGVGIARWLTGTEPVKVQASACWHENGADVHSAGILTFPDSVIATVEASFISALQQTYTVVGTDSVIELPHNAYIPWEADADIVIRGRDDETGRKKSFPGADEYQLMVEHFADCVLNKKIPDVTLADSIQNLRVLDAMKTAARTGQVIDLG